jgi:hypothetical protein
MSSELVLLLLLLPPPPPLLTTRDRRCVTLWALLSRIASS